MREMLNISATTVTRCSLLASARSIRWTRSSFVSGIAEWLSIWSASLTDDAGVRNWCEAIEMKSSFIVSSVLSSSLADCNSSLVVLRLAMSSGPSVLLQRWVRVQHLLVISSLKYQSRQIRVHKLLDHSMPSPAQSR